MPDLPISQLPELSGAGLAADDSLAIADKSASETKQIKAKDLVQAGVQLIDPGSIPGDKINITVPPGSIGTAELADGSVTAPKLADQSAVLYKDPSEILTTTGDFIGQLFIENQTGITTVWTGSQWEPLAGVLGVDGSALDPLYINAYITGNQLKIETAHKATNGANQFLAGPTDSAGSVSYRKIESSDLPSATSTDLGGVKPGSGLAVDGNGILSVDNTVTPSTTNHVVTYDANGLVTGGRAITGADLPTATDSGAGVIIPGTGLVMGSNSELNHSNSVSAGEATKVAFDAQGHITSALPLQASDIPNLSYDQITSGEIGQGVLGDCAVEANNLCDYATVLMQEDNPGQGEYLGQLWWVPSTAQLYVYARGSGPENVWRPVGFGALQANNLRWGGTIDANLGTIGVLTAIGVAEGLTAGAPIPAPSDKLSGIYFITQVEGNSINQPNVSGTTFTAGDWLLCINASEGYIHIDAGVGGGGGGGGGANYLNDLLDVELGGASGPFSTIPAMTLSDKNIFKYDGGSGMWRNTDLIDGGTY